MSKNTYHINVTLMTSVQVEADDEQAAYNMVSDEVYEAGYGDLDIIASVITETIVDGPAHYEAWRTAWNVVYAVEARHGRDSNEYKAAKAAAEALPSGI